MNKKARDFHIQRVMQDLLHAPRENNKFIFDRVVIEAMIEEIGVQDVQIKDYEKLHNSTIQCVLDILRKKQIDGNK